MRTGLRRRDGLTYERFSSLLSYDPHTGSFRWLVKRGGRVKSGETPVGFLA